MVSLQILHEGITRCTACPLAKNREHAVPGEGPAKAMIMFVGEAPGREEDKVGLPFVGRSGKYLDTLLAAIRHSRSEFFITSSVKCRPPGNRLPQPCELETCRKLWLLQQIEAIKPRVIVCLGGVSARTLLGTVELKKQHGTIIKQGGLSFFVTYHPSAAMRFPKIREAMQADFVLLNRVIRSCKT